MGRDLRREKVPCDTYVACVIENRQASFNMDLYPCLSAFLSFSGLICEEEIPPLFRGMAGLRPEKSVEVDGNQTAKRICTKDAACRFAQNLSQARAEFRECLPAHRIGRV
jgi:hypothetical protein